jgi:hypothetical protein
LHRYRDERVLLLRFLTLEPPISLCSKSPLQ